MSAPSTTTKRLVGWTMLLAWLVVTEELVRLYGPLWGALWVLCTLTGAVVAVASRGGDGETRRES